MNLQTELTSSGVEVAKKELAAAVAKCRAISDHLVSASQATFDSRHAEKLSRLARLSEGLAKQLGCIAKGIHR